MKGNVLFIDTVHPALSFRLEQDHWKCIDASAWSLEEILNRLPEISGIVIRSRYKLDEPFLRHGTGLKFIARAGAGMENIDVPFAESRGIACLNAPEGNRNAVAEHALGMLLSLLNNLVRGDREVREGKWLREKNRGVEVDGKTVGIIGFGNTGAAFAKKLLGFNCTILAFDPYIEIDRQAHPNVIQVHQLHELQAQCDIVSLHVPLTGDTSHMVNREFINRYAKPFYLINTSRGQVVHTADLADALESGNVRGAALDVLEFESLSFENLPGDRLPEAFRRLTTRENVILSPHVAGWTFESHRKISEVLADKITARF